MGLFSTKPSENNLNWEHISEEAELRHLFMLEENKPILFYKHSTRCSISSMVLNRLEKEWGINENECKLAFIDLIKHRNISNLLSDISDVTHQSPQVILVKNGKVIYNASHSAISASHIFEILKTHK